MNDKCPKCDADVLQSHRSCPVCSSDVGFPNVRVAMREDEREALAIRRTSAEVSATARGVSAELAAFEGAVAQSKAVMNRSLGALSDWLNGQSPLFLSFHKQVEALGRSPSAADWDQQRAAAESAINPFSYRELNLAALGSVDKMPDPQTGGCDKDEGDIAVGGLVVSGGQSAAVLEL